MMESAVVKRRTFRWDLDKTYLKTDFESLRGLVKIPFERASDKVAAAGVAALIRGLRRTAVRSGLEVRVRFVSGSPPQIGKAILEKLAMDGIEHEGVTFKDQWGRIRRGKFRDLREQVGYKLTELLRDRRREPPGTEEYLFGDDWESDPLAYSLYADVLSGAIGSTELARILAALNVDAELAVLAEELLERLNREDAVRRIFINLARRTPPRRLAPYGSRLVPTFNYLQTAACLFDAGVFDLESVEEVVAVMLEEHGYDPKRLVNSLRDVERRGHLSRAGGARLACRLGRDEILPAAMERRSRWRDLWLRLRRRLRIDRSLPVPQKIDYDRLIPALAEQVMLDEAQL
jgi:hypothetical protein